MRQGIRWSASIFVALHRSTWPICAFRYRRRPLAPVYSTFVFMQ